MASSKVSHVVADAGAFLRNAVLQEIGAHIYTVPDVVDEIRDKPTRRRLAVLPYDLLFREPKPENIQLVTDFSKKTGDYVSLSATDIKVLALTYQLEVEHVGTEHIRKEPPQKVCVSPTTKHPEAPVNVAGFPISFQSTGKKEDILKTQAKEETKESTENKEFNSFFFWRSPLPSIEDDLLELMVCLGMPQSVSVTTSLKEASLTKQDHEADKSSSEEEEDDDDDDNGGGWITPSNIKQIQQDMGSHEAPVNVVVGCLTTDFAMQNVLLQMGLNVLSVDGMLIRQTRNYILRCHGCFKTTADMTKVFCPNCGNKTLKKVAVSVDEDGSLHVHFSRNPKVLNTQGLRYSLPAPQGGKHASNPHLVWDQNFPQQRLSKKARSKTDVFNPDYIAGASPFAENDIYSRAANLNIRDGAVGAGRRRVNPNAPRKKGVKKR
ncbi:LOW QUALITY PROTEIN: RNA-binding protein NOB1 [Hyla sarda]|uniref:LOW QUALITY PROTEIN: RNA-binding protein NOB1 n=1 Tax=Hyla sarda TaxID=327740 RepID=UPI0024C337C2|nr:LOW QUALITY PROTEIN: RNA-binding protein NOB1 [Hyla sarda]